MPARALPIRQMWPALLLGAALLSDARGASQREPAQRAASAAAPLAAADGSTRGEEPRLAIGAPAPEQRFVDTHFLPRNTREFGAARALVIAFLIADCPLAGRYLPTLAALERETRAQGAQFLALYAGSDDRLLEIATQQVESGCEFPFGRDEGGAAARAFGVARSPEVVVLDAARVLRYRGRVDDQYRLGGARAAPAAEELRAALESVLAGRSVALAESEVDGCLLPGPAAPDLAPPPDFAAVEPVLRASCAGCHRAGGSAPFALDSERAARAHAGTLAEAVELGRMPPWYASPRYGNFANDRRLAESARSALVRWARAAQAGRLPALAEAAPAPAADASSAPAPAADASSAPAPRAWRIGEPDLVLRLASELSIPAAGELDYLYLPLVAEGWLPYVFSADTWVSAIEIRPSNPAVLHHANLGSLRLGEEWSDEHFLTGQVPGAEPFALAPGLAVRIPKGALLGLEIHHVTSGRPERDQIEVGLRFPRETVKRELRHRALHEDRFEIPPFAPAHELRARWTLPEDATLYGMFAHMHLRGRDMRFTARAAGAEPQTLLLVPCYSFDWQHGYRCGADAPRLAAGTELELVAHFDNSRANPYNPKPEAAVRFGRQTRDEMMYGFVFYTLDGAELGLRVSPKTGQVLPKLAPQ